VGHGLARRRRLVGIVLQHRQVGREAEGEPAAIALGERQPPSVGGQRRECARSRVSRSRAPTTTPVPLGPGQGFVPGDIDRDDERVALDPVGSGQGHIVRKSAAWWASVGPGWRPLVAISAIMRVEWSSAKWNALRSPSERFRRCTRPERRQEHPSRPTWSRAPRSVACAWPQASPARNFRRCSAR
jgi:hypothetical protein